MAAYAPLDVATLAFSTMQVPLPSAYGDNSPGMNAFRAVWQNGILIPVLREFGWNAAKKRTTLAQPSFNITAASFDGIQTVTLTFAAPHGLQVGQTIYLAGTNPAGWGGTYVITAVPTNLTLTYMNAPVGAYVSGGTVTWAPLMDWSFVYTLPTDWVRVIRMQKVGVADWFNYSSVIFRQGQTTPDFAVENGQLLTNYQVAQILYVAVDQSTPPNPPNYSYMVEVLASRTRWMLAAALTGANDKAVERLGKMYELELTRAKTNDAQEGSPERMQEDAWIQSRAGRGP